MNTASPTDVATKLLAYCRTRDWAGYDPYDALNSRLFACLPFSSLKFPRLLLTQTVKRSPVNVRRLLLIPPTQNPKGLALFLMALLRLRKLGYNTDADIAHLTERLRVLRSPDHRSWAWGYSFPWQGRKVFAPRGEPNLVCTMFVADAFLDVYDTTHAEQHLEIATSAARYIAHELFWTDGSIASFSYPQPGTRSLVHNANLLAASLLCRVARETGESELREIGLKAARYSVSRQQPDGSWFYGELPTQHWIDNFHTGFNLRALQSIGRSLRSDEFDDVVRRGFEFYRSHFFAPDGAPKYFHNETYPIDVHSAADSLITLSAFAEQDISNLELARRVYAWTIANLRDPAGYFYYQKRRRRTVKTSYMRWGQAWMLLGLATFLEQGDQASAATDVIPASQLRGAELAATS